MNFAVILSLVLVVISRDWEDQHSPALVAVCDFIAGESCNSDGLTGYSPDRKEPIFHATDTASTDIGAADNEAVADEVAVEMNLLTNNVPVGPDTESIFEPIGMRLAETEVKIFGDLLQRVIRYNPEQRLQAKDILKHPWVTSFEDD
ncbi:hypothetical protein V1506DRAFT_506269 [Lipomyces tetrasporus]